MHSSLIGQMALIAFIPVCIALFNKLRLDQAAAISLVGAVLFLPELINFDPPLIPPLNKHSISILSVYVAVSMSREKQEVGGSLFVKVIGALLVVGAVGSVVTNGDMIRIPPGVMKPGLPLGDVISLVWRQMIMLVIPFMIGRQVFHTKESLLALMKVVAGGGVIYGFLMLVEIRLSPQLNTWVYGFHQHSFEQAVRNGGYRPVVFMSHGLTTTMYCLMAIFAAIGLQKSGEQIFGIKATLWSLFLTGVLLLSNSMGALIFCLFGQTLLWLGRPKLIALGTTALAAAAIAVPFLRTSQSIPLDAIVDYFTTINAERASSLAFRINTEETLIEKWQLRPWFGYAGYGRADIYNEEGKNVLFMDSQWIIAFVYRGITGFLGEFLLYALPVLGARKYLTRTDDPVLRPLLLSLAMMISITSFDLLLNSSPHCLLPLFAGSLFGVCTTLSREQGLVRV